MKPINDLEQAIANLPLQPRAGLEERIVSDASKAPAEAAATPVVTTRKAFNKGIRIMHNTWFRYAAAAAIALAVLAGLRAVLPGRGESGIAFAQVVQNIRTARSVTYTQVVEMAGQPAMTFQEMRMEPGLTRTYYTHGGSFPVIQIMDCSLARQIQVHPDSRKAHVIQYVNSPRTASPSTNPFESMMQIGETSGQLIGEKVIGDRPVRGFRVKQHTQQAEIWADAQTGLPVLVEITQAGGRAGDYRQDASKWTFRDFTWNQKLDRQLFSVEPPAGYEVEESELDLAPAGEKDLVEALRLWTDATGGVFPQALDREAIPTPGMETMEVASSGVSLGDGQSVGVVSTSSTVAGGASLTDYKTVIANKLKMMRGLDFAQSVRKQDWRYVGGGIKRTDADKLVCRWKPHGSETYRVIYGDLTVRDVRPEDLPQRAADAPATQP